jgi:hypothetical protein
VRDLSKVTVAYNIPFIVMPDQTNLREDVGCVLAMDGRLFMDVRVIQDEMRGAVVLPKQDGSFVSTLLEDLFPFLSGEGFLASVIVKPLSE